MSQKLLGLGRKRRKKGGRTLSFDLVAALNDEGSSENRIWRIGVVSDTHGLLRPEVPAYLKEVDAIIHAGDIGHNGILDLLTEMAPVFAVHGNCDRGPLVGSFPANRILQAGTSQIYVLHDLQKLNLIPEIVGFDVVVHGHTHRPSSVLHQGVLYVNPGSIGPRRGQLPVSLGILRGRKGQWTFEIHTLEH